MEIITYVASNIFKQPSLFLGFVAMLGLILQRKSFGDTVKGTFKTIIGVIILFIGVNLLGTAVAPLSTAFGTLYNIPSENVFDPNTCWVLLGEYGTQIGIVLIAAFSINLLVAKFTPIKNIFLTGHIFFWIAYLMIGTGVELGFGGSKLVIFATIFTAFWIIIPPALMRPLVKKLTKSDSFTIGHSATMFCFLGHFIGKVVGNKEKSTEDIKIPKSLDFFRDTTIATSLVMIVIYIVVGLIVGNETATVAFGGASGIYTIGGASYDLLSFSIMAGLTFGAGFTILLTGVRMMLAEIIPAFKGISDKLIPNAIPVLDIPMIFPYAPNALMIGFLGSMVTSILTIVIMAVTGSLHYAVIPLVVACFFDIAPGAIFANQEGGRVAAIVTSLVSGVVMVLLLIGSIALFKETTAGFHQIYSGNGFSLWSIITYYIGLPFS